MRNAPAEGFVSLEAEPTPTGQGVSRKLHSPQSDRAPNRARSPACRCTVCPASHRCPVADKPSRPCPPSPGRFPL